MIVVIENFIAKSGINTNWHKYGKTSYKAAK